MHPRPATAAAPPGADRLATAPHVRLAPEPASPARARAFVTRNCPFGGEVRDAALLLVSELATNVVLHARTTMDVALLAERDRLVLTVTDACDEMPPAPHPTDTRTAAIAEHGRGLALVDQLTDQWGVARHPGGKTVWCVLPTTGTDGDRRH